MRLTLLLAVFAGVLLAAYRPAEPPSEAVGVPADSTGWVNLRVLPDSLSRDELTAIMRGFTEALGVRCSFCHVRADDAWDFPSDANAHKDVARGMIAMTRQINHELLPSIDGLGHDGAPQVTCYTCHRGNAHPATAAPDED